MPAHAATNLGFSALSVNVGEGETFDIAIHADPQGIKNYTLKAEINFPPDLLEVTEFVKTGGWIPLVQPGFDLIDNDNGVFIKTGGYVGGFSAPATLGMVTFKAKKAGTGTISATANSMVLDANSQNVISSALPGIDITIRAADAAAPTVVCGNGVLENGEGCDDGNQANGDGCSASCTIEELQAERELIEELPAELFDITLELDDYTVPNIKELGARLTFISFGRVPTPVDLTFTIKDSSGKAVHTQKGDIVVETEGVYNVKFEDITLSLGKYTLVAETLYNTDVYDEFTQSFEIAEEAEAAYWIWYGLGALILVIVIGYLARRKRNR